MEDSSTLDLSGRKAQIEQPGSRTLNTGEKKTPVLFSPKRWATLSSNSILSFASSSRCSYLPFPLLSQGIKSIVSFSFGSLFPLVSSSAVLFPRGLPKWALGEKRVSQHFNFCFLLFICIAFIIFSCWLPRTCIQYAEVTGFPSFS